MDFIDIDLKNKLNKLNDKLKNKIHSDSSCNTTELIRKLLTENMGKIKKISPMSAKEINLWANRKPIIAVDGSTNSYGSTFPYQLFAFQAMAKSSIKVDGVEHMSASDIYSPLNDEDRIEILDKADETGKHPDDIIMQKRAEILAALEVEVAIAAVKKFKPLLVMFDGGFLRYASKCPILWDEYKKLAADNNVLSVGVIEEVGTYEIDKKLGNLVPQFLQGSFDREMLFGTLNLGEVFYVDPNIRMKKDYYTCFARLAQDPQAIAFDCFKEDIKEIENIIRLCYALTPVDSRGINLWLDIVDEKIKISNEVMNFLITTYVSDEIKEKFLTQKRSKRSL